MQNVSKACCRKAIATVSILDSLRNFNKTSTHHTSPQVMFLDRKTTKSTIDTSCRKLFINTWHQMAAIMCDNLAMVKVRCDISQSAPFCILSPRLFERTHGTTEEERD
jgi:hypothetical protein